MLLDVHKTEINLLNRGFWFLPEFPVAWDTIRAKLIIRQHHNLRKVYLTAFVTLILNLSCCYTILTYLCGYRTDANFKGIVVLIIASGPLALSLYCFQFILLNYELIKVLSKCLECTAISLNRKFS